MTSFRVLYLPLFVLVLIYYCRKISLKLHPRLTLFILIKQAVSSWFAWSEITSRQSFPIHFLELSSLQFKLQSFLLFTDLILNRFLYFHTFNIILSNNTLYLITSKNWSLCCEIIEKFLAFMLNSKLFLFLCFLFEGLRMWERVECFRVEHYRC